MSNAACNLSRLPHSCFRWALSLALFALTAVVLFLVPTTHDETSDGSTNMASGDTGAAVTVGFTDSSNDPDVFVSSMFLDGDGETQLGLAAVGMAEGIHDTLQVLINFDTDAVDITSAQCSGLFGGALSPALPVAVESGQVAFMCGVQGGVAGAAGAVITLTVQTIVAAETTVDLNMEGPFGSRVFAAGIPTAVESAGAVTLSPPEPEPPPTPAPDPTATPTPLPTETPVAPTATPVQQSGGGGGGGGFAPASTPTPAPAVPGVPTNVEAAPLDGAVELQWSEPSNSDTVPINEYAVRSGDGQVTAIFQAPATTAIIENLENGLEYVFRVQAIGNAGAGPYSDLSSPVTPAGPPSIPQTFTAEAGTSPGDVSLLWTDPEHDNGAAIEAFTISEQSAQTSPVSVNAQTFSHSFSGLLPGTYVFEVSAVNSAGSGPHAAVSFEVPAPVIEAPIDPLPTPTTAPETQPTAVPTHTATPFAAPTPTAPPTATATAPASLTPSAQNTDPPTSEVAITVPTLAPTPEAQPTATAAPETTPTQIIDTGLPIPNSGSSSGPSVVVIAALAVVGLATAGTVAGYAINMRRSPPGTLILAAITGASVLILITRFEPDTSTAAGPVMTEGDAAQRSDAVRANFAVSGAGMTVGIISDSIGCDASALAADIANGELPEDIEIVDDAGEVFCEYTDDRGRILAQIIHDVAPGAHILFGSAITGETSMASLIQSLVAAGADVIIDDLLYASELIYQDDVIAQAVDDAADAGVVYVSSAGRTNMASYEAAFSAGSGAPAGCLNSACLEPGAWHDFDPGSGFDHKLGIALTGDSVRAMLQWPEPSDLGGGDGPLTDLDLVVLNDANEVAFDASAANTSTGEPVEVLTIHDLATAQIAVVHRSGPAPASFKLVFTNGTTITEYETGSSTIVGHRNAAGAITVGPVNYADTAAFGGTPIVEPDAPTGGTVILLDNSGNALEPPVVRQKPDLVAPSGVQTTMGTIDGSAAAAAHVAGAAALLLELGSDLYATGQLDPEAIRWLLAQTAIDVGDEGFDSSSGHGLVDVLAAANLLNDEPPESSEDAFETDMNSGLVVSAPGVLVNDTDHNGHALGVQLVTDVSNGSLALNADGSFTYTPDNGFVGEDSFTYEATDGIFTGAPVEVTITVNGIESLETSVTLHGVDAPVDPEAFEILVELSDGETIWEQTVTASDPSINFAGLPPGTYSLNASSPGFLAVRASSIVLGTLPGETVLLDAAELPAGDADGSGSIDSTDATILADSFGLTHAPGDITNGNGKVTDLNGDGFTTGADASLAISNTGLAEPLLWPGTESE